MFSSIHPSRFQPCQIFFSLRLSLYWFHTPTWTVNRNTMCKPQNLRLNRHGEHRQQRSWDDLRQLPHPKPEAAAWWLGSSLLGTRPGQWQHKQFIIRFARLLLLQRFSQGWWGGQGQEHWHQQVWLTSTGDGLRWCFYFCNVIYL